MKEFKFKQEVKCNCGCNRILGIILGRSKASEMWAVAAEAGIAFVNGKNMVAVENETKETAIDPVKIPKEIADVLDLKAYSSTPNAMWEILNKHAHKLFKTSWLFEKGNLIKLARAIEDGYEVEGPVINKGDYFVYENSMVKWIARCTKTVGFHVHFDYAIEFKLGRYDYDEDGSIPSDTFDVRVATKEEVKELQRAAAFVKNNRRFNLFKPYDVATDKKGNVVRVEKETDNDGNVVVFYGNEEDEYLAVSRPASELTLRYLAEDRVDLEG
ncbi:hypothetical protein P4K49_29665 [Bacillus cereus]|uniref:hypothetical protein n=1 Tax=Bacillati TaxID=1783272 RepID=UPI000676C1E4|nr:hypothetical protein [Bacillus thuringiensis]MEB8879720.1 hypothetical protein [Bacillus cereus]AKR38503.1 Hypothetical protein NF53_p2011 [Bacillus thuringiensis serovar indiana]MBG9642295.1 hypothetical protein [Bacillus thuringiensis]MBG9642354.1 hypothetical protein [Bacillus thuringiensis]MBG9649130.1 hypothetical protein [Bacillus thuringiensis]